MADSDMHLGPTTAERAGVVCHLADELTPETEARLDAFLSKCPSATSKQTVHWPGLAPATRLQRFRYLWCEDSGELLLGGVVRFTRLFPGRRLAAFDRGPVFREILNLDRCLPQVMATLRRAGVCTVLMNPRWEDSNAERVHRVLVDHGFRELDRVDQPTYSVTGVVDLTRPKDEIFAGFQGRGRRGIRSAARKGLTVRPAVTNEDAARFRTLFAEFAADRGINLAEKPDVMDQWRFVQKQNGAFLLAEFRGALVGGLLVFREGARAIVLTAASVGRFPALARSHSLIWEAMLRMKRSGCQEFDFAGLTNDGDTNEQFLKTHFFKMAFNPRVVRLVPIHAAALRPLSHTVLFPIRQAYRRSPVRQYLGPLLKR